MIRSVHRILKFSGKYALRIRAAYLFSFLKSFCSNAPLMIAVLTINMLMGKTLTVISCFYIAAAMLLLLLLGAFFHHISDRLQSSAGYEVFAEKRLMLGEYLKHLPMDYFTTGHLGKISSLLSNDMVYSAAKKARCYDFIMKLPFGFDTVIGEGGSTLSGGEAQRISIARCILKDSPIIILDEATASVDADNEKLIGEALSELCRDKTLIVIAHRLNTIRSADKIIVLDDGKIDSVGTHDSLIKESKLYKRLISMADEAPVLSGRGEGRE